MNYPSNVCLEEIGVTTTEGQCCDNAILDYHECQICGRVINQEDCYWNFNKCNNCK